MVSSHQCLKNGSRDFTSQSGNMVYVNNLGTGYLFLNSYEDAVELFEKRGNIYSDRHKTIMLEL